MSSQQRFDKSNTPFSVAFQDATSPEAPGEQWKWLGPLPLDTMQNSGLVPRQALLDAEEERELSRVNLKMSSSGGPIGAGGKAFALNHSVGKPSGYKPQDEVSQFASGKVPSLAKSLSPAVYSADVEHGQPPPNIPHGMGMSEDKEPEEHDDDNTVRPMALALHRDSSRKPPSDYVPEKHLRALAAAARAQQRGESEGLTRKALMLRAGARSTQNHEGEGSIPFGVGADGVSLRHYAKGSASGVRESKAGGRGRSNSESSESDDAMSLVQSTSDKLSGGIRRQIQKKQMEGL